jgi:hypothetical protein
MTSAAQQLRAAQQHPGRAFCEAMGWTLDGGTRDEARQVRYRRQLQRDHS